jgi:hypothetical protein
VVPVTFGWWPSTGTQVFITFFSCTHVLDDEILLLLRIRIWDGAVAGGRLELRPPVESSDLDKKVLTTTPVRDTSSVGSGLRFKFASVTYFPPTEKGSRRGGSAGRGGRGWMKGGKLGGSRCGKWNRRSEGCVVKSCVESSLAVAACLITSVGHHMWRCSSREGDLNSDLL